MEEIMLNREVNPKEIIPEEENQEGAKIFGKLAGASLLYALVYTGCLFENVMGLASVLWVAASVWYVRFVFRMFGEKERRDNGIVLGMMVLLGISTVLTGNEWIGWMNDLIIFVLLVGILLHNFAQDAGWNFGKYLAEIVAAVCGAVCFIGKPQPKIASIYHIVLEAQLAGIRAIKQGAVAKQVDNAARSVITREGYGDYFTHG